MHWVFVSLASVLATLAGAPASPEKPPSVVPPDWRAQFLAQAPAEYARLEATVSRWEMRYAVNDTSYARDSRRVSRESFSQCRTVFDDRLGGIRSESQVVGVPGMVVIGVNPQYRFEADSEKGQPFVISWYKDAQQENRAWTEKMREYRGLVAEDLDGSSLLGLMENGALKIKTVSNVDVGGRQCIRIDCDQIWNSARTNRISLYPGVVVIDPSFHWAVRSYEQDNGGGGRRRASIEYNPTITEVAFPKRIVQEDVVGHDRVSLRMVMDFEDPRPSHAVAKDFTLESVGLERPLSKVERRNRNIVLMMLINGGCLFGLVVWFMRRRRAKQRAAMAGPAVATG